MTDRSRRQLLFGIMLAASDLAARDVLAQPRRLVKIGALTESWGPTPSIVGLRDGLQELGYREDRDFTIGVRFTEGKAAELPTAARDLVQLGVDIIVTSVSGKSAKAAQMATKHIPIVFMGSGDPVGLGLVQSFARPGGNITGIADLDIELLPKRMQIFREMVPGLRRILLPYDATNPDAVALLAVHRDAARHLGLTLVEKPLRSEEEARATITGLRKGEADGIVSLRFLSLNIPGFMLEVASRGVIATMFHAPFFV
ncbi:MAG: ABC transporter substrate-binding protein, partial [Tepidiformaceae bacterium]